MPQLPVGCGYKALKKEQKPQQNTNGNGDPQKIITSCLRNDGRSIYFTPPAACILRKIRL